MDSPRKNVVVKAAAVQPSAINGRQQGTSSRTIVSMRMLATAGVVLGFAAGFAMNFLSQPSSRAFIAEAQALMTPAKARPTEAVALVETAPMLAED